MASRRLEVAEGAPPALRDTRAMDDARGECGGCDECDECDRGDEGDERDERTSAGLIREDEAPGRAERVGCCEASAEPDKAGATTGAAAAAGLTGEIESCILDSPASDSFASLAPLVFTILMAFFASVESPEPTVVSMVVPSFFLFLLGGSPGVGVRVRVCGSGDGDGLTDFRK